MTTKILKKTLIKSHPFLEGKIEQGIDSKKRFDVNLTNGNRLEFKKLSGIKTQSDLEKILNPVGAKVIRPAFASAAPKYKNCGFLIEWEGYYYSTLLKANAIEKPRKAFSPDNIGLGSKIYTPGDKLKFRQDIIDGLAIECDNNTKLFLAIVSMLDYVEFGSPLSTDLIKMKTSDLNEIICDFGEVVCAYRDLLLGIAKKEIKFPIKSNEKVVDYWRDDEIISVKGPKGGGKLNLVLYKEVLINQSDIGKFLLAHSEHNREDYFKYAAKICPWVNAIANLVGGTSINDLKQFISIPRSFDKFYQLLSDKTFPGIGLPKKNQAAIWRMRWEEEQSLNPIWFSIITVMTRWGKTNQKTINEISEIMKPLFSTEKFININIDGINITIDEVFFKDVETWSTHYHSNAGGAWANWPSILVSEKND